MAQQNRSAHPFDLDTRVLSDFIYELNIARRQLSLYPPGHPLIGNSSHTALTMLGKLCESRDSITFGVAPDALLFEQEWLDRKNPVYRDFATFLSGFGIASICFQRDLAGDELIRFNQLLRNSRKAIEKGGGFPALLNERQISHISVIPIDYDLFRTSDLDSQRGSEPVAAEFLWEDFLQGLLADELEADGQTSGTTRRINLAAVAEILNRRLEDGKGHSLDYDQAISSFVAQLKSSSNPASAVLPGQQLGELLGHLNPELRRQFLGSALRTLDRHPEAAPELLQLLPREALVDTLESWNDQQQHISTRLLDLLGHFSACPSSSSEHSVAIKAEPLDEEILKARMEILFARDDHDRYLPEAYQHTLQSILSGEIRGTVTPELAHQLQGTLEKQAIEHQFCAVLFNILESRTETDVGSELQENLAELSHYFLDTGDFGALREIYLRWSRYLYSTKADIRYLDEKVLAIHTRESFMEEVLDSVAVWGQEKYDDICAYIVEIGEPYAELLVERLGYEPQMALRRTWMKLLVELGGKATQIVTAALRDERWYLVRNLLIVLGRQRDRLPVKEILLLAGHDHPRVRQEALRILFRINPPTANRYLLKELDSHDPHVLLPALQIAELSRDPAVLERLHQLLSSDKLEQNQPELNQQLLATLATIGSADSLTILQHLLQKKGLLQSRRSRELKQEIIRTLGRYPSRAVEPLLRGLIDDRNEQLANLAAEQLRLLTRTVS